MLEMIFDRNMEPKDVTQQNYQQHIRPKEQAQRSSANLNMLYKQTQSFDIEIFIGIILLIIVLELVLLKNIFTLV